MKEQKIQNTMNWAKRLLRAAWIIPYCVLLTGCVESLIVPDDPINPPDTDERVTMGLIMTYATGDDINALAGEEKLTSACVLIYNSAGSLENAGDTRVDPIAPSDTIPVNHSGLLNRTWTVYAGTKDIYVITNPNPVDSAWLNSKTTPPTKAQVEIYQTAAASFSTDTSIIHTKGMLMTGKLSSVAVSAPTTTVTVPVTRRHARIEFKIRKANDMTSTVKITNVEFHNANTVTTLYNSNTGSTLSSSSEAMSLNIPAGYPNYTDIRTYYSYTRPGLVAGTDEAAYLHIKALVNGTQKEYDLCVSNTNSKDDPMDIEANKIYRVRATMHKQADSISVKLVVCPWNVEEPQEVISGDGYEVALPNKLKLLRNVTTNIMPENVDGANVTAAWVKVKVSNGTTYRLVTGSDPIPTVTKFSMDGGVTWINDTGNLIGDGTEKQVWIYRPYVDGNEPLSGPSLSLVVAGTPVQTFVVEGRDQTLTPTNCFILRPYKSTTPVNETVAYIPLQGVYDAWSESEELQTLSRNNTSPIPSGQVTAEVLWVDRVSGGTYGLSPANVLQAVQVNNDMDGRNATLVVQAGGLQGNAVVAMKVGGVIYWSFHIWVTEYNPNTAAGQKNFNGLMWMDRNLGATRNDFMPLEGGMRGMFYQWGRKDPFPNSKDWSLTFPVIYSPSFTAGTNANGDIFKLNVTTASAMDARGHTLAYSLNHPTDRMWDSGNSIDWYTTTNANQNLKLWNTTGGNKTAFDPCPKGWRVAPWKNGSSFAWDGLSVDGGSYTSPMAGLSVLSTVGTSLETEIGYLPFAGDLIETSIQSYPTGMYWTASPSNTTPHKGHDATLGNPIQATTDSRTWHGHSVRCIKEP